tara:strand:+ start:693 stop:1502 length:810 start_codon:yes stop_codon:yes gene_type:complete
MLSTKNSYGGKKAVKRYQEALKRRQEQYSHKLIASPIADEIKKRGYCICKDAINRDIITTLKEEMNQTLRDKSKLKSRDEYFAAIKNPLYTIPLCFDIAISEFLDTVATAYLECKPAIGTTNLRKSYVTNLPDKHTLLYHSDRNSIKFLKFFFYLNDVDAEGGPFTYVEGSHIKKFSGWDKKYRWKDDEIINAYGNENIAMLTANAGDIIVADSTGFHKGSKPLKRNRMMFTVNYVIHPEDWKKPQEPVRKTHSVPESKKHLTDFLVYR